MFFICADIVVVYVVCIMYFVFISKEKKEKKRKKKEERKRKKKHIVLVCVVCVHWVLYWALWEDWIRSLGLWAFFHAYLSLIPHCSLIFYGSLATYPYIPYLVPSPITTLESPSDLYVHVCWVWMLEACQAYGSVCFMKCLRVNTNLYTWEFESIHIVRFYHCNSPLGWLPSCMLDWWKCFVISITVTDLVCTLHFLDFIEKFALSCLFVCLSLVSLFESLFGVSWLWFCPGVQKAKCGGIW